MKVVPQITTFLVVLAISWFAYDRHEAFRSLIDDVVDYSGFTRQISHEAPDVSQSSIASSTSAVDSTQDTRVTVDTAEISSVADMVKKKPEQSVVAQAVTEQEKSSGRA